MHDSSFYDEEDLWVIWNSAYGIVDTVTLKPNELGQNSSDAWLDEPYDMVGPFSLTELEERGQIHFAACIVMTRQKWQENQVKLRQESLRKRREAQRLFEERARENSYKRGATNAVKTFDEKHYRTLLNLPLSGVIHISQVKKSYRKIVKEIHPDVGGSHERFVQITEARDALLVLFS